MGKRIVGSPSRVQGTRPWAMLVLYFDSDGTKRLHFHIFITRTPQCVALLWSYFIPVTAGVRCYSEWMFRCTCGCQWVHFYKSWGTPEGNLYHLHVFSCECFIFWKDWPGCQNETEQHPPFLYSVLTGKLCSLCSWLKELNFSHLAAVTISR